MLTMDEVLRMEHKNMLIMLRGEQILEIEKFDYTRNPESRKFEPVSIKGLKEVPQYPPEPVRRPANREPHQAVDLPSATEPSGEEVVQNVADKTEREPVTDYSGPTIRQIKTPGI